MKQAQQWVRFCPNNNNIDRFLDFSKTLQEEGINSKSDLIFKAKHMKTPKEVNDPVAEELLFQQVQQGIIKELYPCPERVAIYLASLEVQAKFGDYNPKKHRVGYLK